MPGTSEVHRGPVAVSSLAGRRGRAGSAGDAVRRRLRLARAAWPAPGPPADSCGTTSRRLKPAGATGGTPGALGVSVRIGPATPVPAGNPRRRREKWALEPDFGAGALSRARPAAQCGHRLRQAGAALTVQPEARIAGWRQEDWAQQDSAGLQGT